MPPSARLAPLYRREWGSGHPVIALHPLGLESSAFAGFGRVLSARGVRVVAVDLPGFGKTPAPDVPLTPATLATPVIDMARRMRRRPTLLGISLGGRVALEAALTAPEAFERVIAIAPALPWRRFRAVLAPLALLDPRLASLVPLERAWPLLRWMAGVVERAPCLRRDELAQAGARFVYYAACPATRKSFLSAMREMMLAPAFGPDGFWTRLPDLSVPAVFMWGQRDMFVTSDFARPVEASLPQAQQCMLECVGHWLNGLHHRCLAHAVASLLDERGQQRASKRTYSCTVDVHQGSDAMDHATGSRSHA